MVMLPSLASIKENDMPLIEVHVIENVFNAEQKRQMISKLTDAMVSIEGEANARRHLGQDFRSRERRLGHRRSVADHGSRQGACLRTQGGLTRCVWHRPRASPAGGAAYRFLILIVHAAVSGAGRL
jgi:hypothetical protein